MTDLSHVFTIEHSTRSIPEFVALLRAGGVRLVVDIRKIPKSRTNPQYDLEIMPEALRSYQIGHARLAELGGLRKRSTVPPEVNALWRNRSFHNYADHALSEEFRIGLAKLQTISTEHPTAIMCAEAVWWRCHRRIVADQLLDEGRSVLHLMSETQITEAVLTPGAVGDGLGLHYPAATAGKDQPGAR